MNRIFIRQFMLALMLPALLIAIACSSDDTNSNNEQSTNPQITATTEPITESSSNPKLDVVTTLYPMTYFAQRVGGDRVNVESLIKGGIEAHDFAPTPGDIKRITEADVLVGKQGLL